MESDAFVIYEKTVDNFLEINLLAAIILYFSIFSI